MLIMFLQQEEMAELKAQLYLLEKEKKALELKLSTREAQEQAYLVHIEHLKSEVEEQKEQRMRSLSSTSSGSKDKLGKVRSQTNFQNQHKRYLLYPSPSYSSLQHVNHCSLLFICTSFLSASVVRRFFPCCDL